ncbi:MAG: phenylacetic acid degradation protein [Firmicutes bacterium]|nr:phenylacetic acid degradation protein [Bacillota bacterium]
MGKRTNSTEIGRPPLALLVIAFTMICSAQVCESSPQTETALDRYISADDPAYTFEVVGEPVSQGFFSTITLNLVSQRWQGNLWSHNVTIYVPLFCRKSGPVTILVNGGARPSKDLQGLSAIAIATQLPIAILGSVPNQPLYGLREDALIAHTFAKYLETGDETWPLLLPMTKSVVACMDALESYFSSEGRFTPRGFIITGASKRGWTSWLSAAADPRVAGIMPMVYDNLNLKAQMDNQLATWGEYSPQIHDYTDLSIQAELESEEGFELAQIVDPYAYLDRLQVPKLIVIGSNDPYWPLGSINLYFDELPGENYVLIMPNTGHSEGDVNRLFPAVMAFQRDIAGVHELPSLSWDFYVDHNRKVARVTVYAPETATVQLWQATSESADFRQSNWTRSSGVTSGPVAEFEMLLPDRGMKAVFADITVHIEGSGSTATFTTTPFIF